MSKCQKNGCGKTATDNILFRNPKEIVGYCRPHALHEYQSNPSAKAMEKRDDTDD